VPEVSRTVTFQWVSESCYLDNVKHQWNYYDHPASGRLSGGLREPTGTVRCQIVHGSGSGDVAGLYFLGTAAVHESGHNEEIPARRW
jgi:hypothetical protein